MLYKTIFISIIGLLLLNAMSALTSQIAHQNPIHYLPYIQLNMLYILFGMLIQWRKTEDILDKKSIHPNSLFPAALILVILTLIPNPLWSSWLHPDALFASLFTHPLTQNSTHSIVGVLSGLLFIQALNSENI